MIKSTRCAVGLAALCLTWAGLAAAQAPDSLECYRVKDVLGLRGTAELDTPQFGVDPGCRVAEARLLCVPATATDLAVTNKRTNQPITPLPVSGPDPGGRICYRVKCPIPATPIANGPVTDPFGTRTMSDFKTSYLCTPAVLGTGFCGDGTRRQVTPRRRRRS